MRDTLDKIRSEKQTTARALRLGAELAIKHGVSAQTVQESVRKALPKKIGWARMEWQKVCPHAPALSPLKNLRAPVLVLRDKPRTWGHIEKKAVLLKFAGTQYELRIQQKHLFANAPKWNPLHKITLPALRFVARPAQSRKERKLEEKLRNEAKEYRQER